MTDRFAILVRHGEYRQKPGTPSALQPFALTDRGKAQARDLGRDLANLLKEQDWTLAPELFSSRQLRAWQTATCLAEILSRETGEVFQVMEDKALAERSVGALANLTIPEIEQVLIDDPRTAPPPEDWKSDSHYRLPVQGAESLLEAGERVAAFIEAKTAGLEGQGENARIFVGHGASLRHAAHHLGVLAFDEIRRLSMHHAKAVVLKRDLDGHWSHHCGAWKERHVLETSTD